jgi:hypothetical protein
MIRYWVKDSEFRSCTDDLSSEGYREVDQEMFYSIVKVHDEQVSSKFEAIHASCLQRDESVRSKVENRKKLLFEKMGLSQKEAEELISLI